MPEAVISTLWPVRDDEAGRFIGDVRRAWILLRFVSHAS